jgi:opacity protein-like surface antigen
VIQMEYRLGSLMKKLVVVCSLALAFSFTAKAQEDFSKLDISAGYSYLRFQFPVAGFNANGGSGQVTYNVNSLIGITGDFGGYHVGQTNFNGSGTIFTYLFGPKLTLRRGKWSPFLQGLFGGAWLGAGIAEVCDTARARRQGGGCEGFSSSDNAFSLAFGGGVDYKASSRISIRLFDVDYLLTRFNAAQIGGTNNDQSNVRVTAGVVLHF